jgi:hypothetical protein
VEGTGAESWGASRKKTRAGLLYAQERKGRREGACSCAAWKIETLLKAFLQCQGEEQEMGLCIQGGPEGVPDTFGASRDTNTWLQRCEAGSEVSALISKAGLYRYKKLYRYKGIEYLYRYNLKCAE